MLKLRVCWESHLTPSVPHLAAQTAGRNSFTPLSYRQNAFWGVSLMANGRDEMRERDQQILSRLSHIQHKVDSIDETNAFALRAEAGKHMEIVKGRGCRR